MTPEQVTQAIQDNITRLWPNHLLTSAQHTLVEEILRKVGVSPYLDDSLDFPHWHSQVTALEQELTQRLTSLPSPPETTGENPATLRFALLWLYNVAAAQAEMKFNNLPACLEFYQSGLSLSQHWQDDTDPRVREQVLNLHFNLGVRLGQAGRVEEAIKQYQSGLSVAQHWQDDTDPRVREQVLTLHFNLGVSLGQAGRVEEAIKQYQSGLSVAQHWQDDTDPRVRKQVLTLHVNLGVSLRQAGRVEEAIKQYQSGLSVAQHWQDDTDPRGREQVLTLHFNLGVTLGQAGRVEEAIKQYQSGLSVAQHWQDDTDPRGRELVLTLHFNLGNDLRQAGRVEEAIKQYQSGLSVAQHWQDDTDPRGRELVLKLHFNLGVSLGQAGRVEEAIKQYQSGLSVAQHWQDDTDPRGRELVLKLHVNLGNDLRQAGRVEEAIKQYQSGLDLVEKWLATGELKDSEVRKQIFELHELNTSTFYNLRQHQSLLLQLPSLGFWSWSHPESIASSKNVKQNWRNKLGIIPSYPQVTTAFQSFLPHLLLSWHDPNRPHRHFGFVSTATLLAISESLYGLEQARQNHSLQQTYAHLATLVDSPEVEQAQRLHQEQQRLQSLPPTSFWRHPFRWWEWQQRETSLDQVAQQLAKLAKQSDWQTSVKRVQQALVTWLKTEIGQRKRLTSKLESLPDIVLGMLLASQSTRPQELLRTWQTNPPWQTVESLTTAFAATHWQDWLRVDDPEKPNKPVYLWTDPFRQQRLTVSNRLAITNRPLLQTWLENLAQGEVQELTKHLQMAWDVAQNQATVLAQIFTVLADPQWQEELFDEDQPTSETATYSALAAVVLGDVDRQLEERVRHWLFANLTGNEVLTTFDYLKECFTRIVRVTGNHTLPELGETVHDWAKVRLEEILKPATTSNALTSPWATFGGETLEVSKTSKVLTHDLWNLLERSRIGLLGLSFQFPSNDWAEKVGKALWESLEISVREIINGHHPTDQEMWPPLQTWLQEITRLQLLPQPPTVAACSQRLTRHEALVQPFFDPIKKWLRLLWLDKTQGLLLRDLPAECRDQTCWYNADEMGICDQWEEIWKKEEEEENGKRKAAKGHSGPYIHNIMTSPPVTSLANTLRHWADSSQCTQLTVIFPAPLGQLPWEMLEPVENLLVRTVSLTKWYASHSLRASSTAPATPWVLGTSNLNPNDLRCSNTEARWVATQWDTTPELPNRPILLFDALQKLATANRILLSTHGSFDRDNPLTNGLLLGGLKADKTTSQDTLPLWLCSTLRVPGEILILSACQSNLSGLQTEGLLSPIGIGPALSAAGAQIVIGCLWEVNEVATLTFIYHLLTLAKKAPNEPWHQLATLARQKVRDMTREEIKEMLTELGVGITKGDYCHFVTDAFKNGAWKLPLSHPSFWAGFNVMQ